MEFKQDHTKARKPKSDHPWKRKIRREAQAKMAESVSESSMTPSEEEAHSRDKPSLLEHS
jgi:hypothetical protein